MIGLQVWLPLGSMSPPARSNTPASAAAIVPINANPMKCDSSTTSNAGISRPIRTIRFPPGIRLAATKIKLSTIRCGIHQPKRLERGYQQGSCVATGHLSADLRVAPPVQQRRGKTGSHSPRWISPRAVFTMLSLPGRSMKVHDTSGKRFSHPGVESQTYSKISRRSHPGLGPAILPG